MEARPARCRNPAWHQNPGSYEPSETCSSYVVGSIGVDEQPLNDRGVQERGPRRFLHASMATACRTHGGSLLATPAAPPAPTQEVFSFLWDHHIFRAEMGGVAGQGKAAPPGLQVSRHVMPQGPGSPYPSLSPSSSYSFFPHMSGPSVGAHSSQLCGPLFPFIHSATSQTAPSLLGPGCRQMPRVVG